MSEILQVVTVNTQYARAISPENIRDFYGTDILMAQEVLGAQSTTLMKSLGRIGLEIANFNEESGLLIAANQDKVSVQETSIHEIEPTNPLNDVLSSLGMKPRFRARGLLTASVTVGAKPFIIATAHPIVCVRPFARNRQIKAMASILDAQYKDLPLIFGSDMNHYPSPRKVDEQFVGQLGLQQTHDKEPTFTLGGTKHSWLRLLGFKDGQLDMLAVRGFGIVDATMLDVASDHKALIASITD